MEKMFDFLKKYIDLTGAERELILSRHSNRTFKRRDHIPLFDGETALGYFVLDGEVALVRSDGEREVITDFFFSGDPVTGTDVGEGASLRCFRATTLAVSRADDVESLLVEFPRFERVCRKFAEEKLSYSMQFGDKLKSLEPLEKYRFIAKERPEIIDKIPQHALAQYLGLAAETLSRMKRQIKDASLD